MGAMPATPIMTADEFLALPDAPELRFAELVAGELVVDSPRARHQLIAGELMYRVMSWVRAGDGRGSVWFDLGLRLDEHNVFQPDLLWYPAGMRLDLDATVHPLPAIAAEVRSPSTWCYDIGAKKAAYEREGLRELWLVDSAADELLIFCRSRPYRPAFDMAVELERADVLTSSLLEGFELPLDELFKLAR
jgi:Uma2 family endonuclease